MQRFHSLLRATMYVALLGLRSNPRRAAYLTTTIAVTFAAWLLLITLASPFVTNYTQTTTGSGIVVRNARASQQPLPLRYAARIATLVGVSEVVYLDIKLVSCADGGTVTINAIGGNGTLNELRHDGFTDADAKRWQDDPLGALIDEKTSRDCGWKVGMGISPPDEINQEPTPLHISGISANDGSSNAAAIAHYEYINRNSRLAGKDRVLRIDVKSTNRDEQEALATRIDAEFAHDDPPVTAYPDTLSENVNARFGKVQYLLCIVICALSLCCALVLASVLAYAVAERRANLALLLVMGFARRLLLFGFVVECLAILLVGTLFGAMAGMAGLHALPDALQALLGMARPPTWAWYSLPIWLGMLLLIALILPILSFLRMRPTDCRG